MKSFNFLHVGISIMCIGFMSCTNAQNKQEPWTDKQLAGPSELAKVLNDSTKAQPIIFDIGPSGKIKGAIVIGAASEKENVEKLKQELSKISKDQEIIIYCGCCPFDKCPNVRPAFALLNKMGFTKHKLLNLPNNLKTNWIDKGYPMQ